MKQRKIQKSLFKKIDCSRVISVSPVDFILSGLFLIYVFGENTLAVCFKNNDF